MKTKQFRGHVIEIQQEDRSVRGAFLHSSALRNGMRIIGHFQNAASFSYPPMLLELPRF